MLISILMNKLRSFFLFFVALFRRALCCFQRRRRISFDEPLMGVVTPSQTVNASDIQSWNDWGDGGRCDKKPQTVQEHIEFYRQQKAQLQKQEETVEVQEDFFDDMTPNITRQKKIFVNTGEPAEDVVDTSRISLVPDVLSIGNELGEWDENPGWEGEPLDWDTLEALKQKKREERERKAFEQQQRRLERTKAHGIKVNS